MGMKRRGNSLPIKMSDSASQKSVNQSKHSVFTVFSIGAVALMCAIITTYGSMKSEIDDVSRSLSTIGADYEKMKDKKLPGSMDLRPPILEDATVRQNVVINRIFTCDRPRSFWDHWVIRTLFPEFRGEVVDLVADRNNQLVKEAGDNDLLLGLLHEDGNLPNCVDDILNFPARQLYLTGESFDEIPNSDKITVISPHPDSKNSVQVSWMAMDMIWSRSRLESAIFGEVARPVNTGEFFMIFLSSHCIAYRETAAKRLAQIGIVHVGENWDYVCKNHVPDPEGPEPVFQIAPDLTEKNKFHGNDKFYSRYRYAMVMENEYKDGYITEKLTTAFSAGTIPVWYGTRRVFDIFNEKAFIFYDIENPEAAIQQIRNLESDKEAYDAMLREPILANGRRTVENYFSLRDDIEGGFLKNRIREKMGLERRFFNRAYMTSPAKV